MIFLRANVIVDLLQSLEALNLVPHKLGHIVQRRVAQGGRSDFGHRARGPQHGVEGPLAKVGIFHQLEWRSFLQFSFPGSVSKGCADLGEFVVHYHPYPGVAGRKRSV